MFTLEAQKLKIKDLKDFKIPGKLLLTAIISWCEKDLNERQKQFDSLISCVNFKSLDKETMVKMGKKSEGKWLQKNSSWLNQIVAKDDDDSEKSGSDDSDKSDKSDKSDSDSEKSDDSDKSDEEDEEGEGGSLPQFDKKLSSSTLIFSKKNTRAKYNSSGWCGTAISKSFVSSYSIKLLNSFCTYLMVGYAPKTIKKNGDNYSSNGYYLYIEDGSLYSQNGDSGKNFTSGDKTQGIIYGAKLIKGKKNRIFQRWS